MNKDINKDMIMIDFETARSNSNVIKKEEKNSKYKFRRSTVIYNFIKFIVKRIYLIDDQLDEELELETE